MFDGKRLARGELQDFASGGQPLDLARQREGDARQPLRHEKLVGPLSIFEELEIRHLHERWHAVEIDRLNRQLWRLEARKRHRPAVDKQRGAHEHLGWLPRPQALPIDMDPGAELV